MWKIFRAQGRLKGLWLASLIIALTMSGSAYAQSTHVNNQTYTNTSTNTHGLFLPSVTVPHGADEVRAGDGTVCRSAMASNSGYLDLGAVGNQDPNRDTLAASIYGRVIVPLGQKPSRLDCRSLYTLELQRLRHELEMAKMGANALAKSGTSHAMAENWEKEGWTDHRATDRAWSKGTSVKPQ